VGLARIASHGLPVAEICRRIGALASDLGFPRPSYEQIRVLVHEHDRCRLQLSTGDVLLDIAARSRPPEALIAHLAGTLRPKKAK
jgi:hypothetical protein